MRTILPLRFESIQTLRETATASTFVATDHVLGRNKVVVKSIRKGSFSQDRSSPADVFSWYRGLQHPHVAGILDAGLTPKGDLFYVRDFAPPTQLFSTRDMDLLNVLLGAVDFVHSMGRVHGSLKPSNILSLSKSIQLVDPWIPQPWRGPLSEEEVRFFAPEVLKGDVRTIESDLYSVGALLYRFYSGRDLFDDADLESLTVRHIWASPRPLTSISYVSRTIADIVENLIHKEPSRRPAAFEALKNELRVRSTAAVRAPAIGMTTTLEQAEQFLRDGVDRLRVLIVEAPIGFGKTRYVEELRGRMAFRVPRPAFSICPAVGRSPDVTVAQWLLSVFQQHCSSFQDPSVRRLQALVDNGWGSALEYPRERFVVDLIDVLASIAQEIPLILVIEDIDRTNKDVGPLIESIVSRATRVRFCIVITSRSSGIAPEMMRTFRDYVGSAVERISLSHLRDEDTESVAAFLERDDERRPLVCRKSGRIPLFVEEYCKNQKAGIPQLVRDTISELVSSLPKQTRHVASVLSLFEEPVSLEVLVHIAGIGSHDLERHLSILQTAGLSDGRLAISHEDAREMLYSQIPRNRRTALHASCYERLKDSLGDKSKLAWHAYHGRLFDIAGRLYLELAQKAFDLKDFKSATRSYEFLQRCRARCFTVPPASVEEVVSFAKCRAYLGDSLSARASLSPLLVMPAVRRNPELLSAVYSALASPFIEPSNGKRVRLLNRAIASLKPDSSTLPYRYGSLANALVGLGDFDGAEMALDKALTYRGEGIDSERAMEMGALILMNRGRFREAANSFLHKKFKWAIPLSVTTNQACCLEQLGAMREARKTHIAALREAKSQGTYLEVLCLGNLASVEFKLGNTSTAQNLFESAVVKLEKTQQGKHSAYSPGVVWYSDAALYAIEVGDYAKAVHFVSKLDASMDRGARLQTFQFLLTRGELYLALGNYKEVMRILSRTQEFVDYGEFFAVERLLLRANLLNLPDTPCNELREAVRACAHLETRYQHCRVLITMAKSLLLQGDLLGSRTMAAEALELALTGGYRLLAARAFLRRGLAAENESQKQSDLMRCLQEASNMGLYPLLAECAFHIGAWRACSGDYTVARDYLFKSVSITARLAEDLSTTDRRRFLSIKPHKEARRLLEEATNRTKVFHSVLREPLGKGDMFLGGLYRLASSMTSVLDFGSILPTLIHAIKQCIQQAGAVVWESGKDTILYPLNENFPEDMRQRARNALAQSHTRIYFSNLGRRDRQGSAAWVPIPCLSTRAGIYIECHGHALLDEQEIQFLTVIATITATALDQQMGTHSPKKLTSSREFSGIVGVSEPMKKICVDIAIASGNAATVLIEGESGTGKELVAKAIHSKSLRAEARFVPVDCGALPENLIEAELFGVRKGSFTGAVVDRRGLFEEADHGTIFLDEIANASLPLQTKLLRVLQEKEIRRVGDTQGKRVDVRLIAATNCNLEQVVREGKFRQDLLFRLKVLHIQLPPLRERREDIPLLANAFLDRLNALNHTRKRFGAEAVNSLLSHEYPGNVRELQNAIEQSYYRSNGDIIAEIALRRRLEMTAEDAHVWFRELAEGQRNFWSAVRDPYKRRDIPRERVLELLDLGLRATRGNYKAVASMFKIGESEYRRFMDFLRRNDCLLDFRPYRKIEPHSNGRGVRKQTH